MKLLAGKAAHTANVYAFEAGICQRVGEAGEVIECDQIWRFDGQDLTNPPDLDCAPPGIKLKSVLPMLKSAVGYCVIDAVMRLMCQSPGFVALDWLVSHFLSKSLHKFGGSFKRDVFTTCLDVFFFPSETGAAGTCTSNCS